MFAAVISFLIRRKLSFHEHPSIDGWVGGVGGVCNESVKGNDVTDNNSCMKTDEQILHKIERLTRWFDKISYNVAYRHAL